MAICVCVTWWSHKSTYLTEFNLNYINNAKVRIQPNYYLEEKWRGAVIVYSERQWFYCLYFDEKFFFLLKICKGHTREIIWYWSTWKLFGHKGDRHWINSFFLIIDVAYFIEFVSIYVYFVSYLFSLGF
jgi:hypothetical protein